MKNRLFNAVPAGPPPTPVSLPSPRGAGTDAPGDYLADEDLADAVNVALLLGQPLLVTGAPGTGKTQLAGAVAWQLGVPLHRFDAKSDSRARDLLYTYDGLGHFRAAQSGASDARPFLTWNALGRAILQACPFDRVADFFPAGTLPHAPARSVVLIDEVDKAPRDFPNDLLAEVEELRFHVPELGNLQATAPPHLRPVLVVTSNSERTLPDAFLRRCVYHHIGFPLRERLAQILERRVPEAVRGRTEFLTEVLDVFDALRWASPPLRKPPGTSELIQWVQALHRADPASDNPLRSTPSLPTRTLGVLAKYEEDLDRARKILERRGPAPR